MRDNFKFFKNSKMKPLDKFFQTVLYDDKIGYYNSNLPFGSLGDFITAPKISRLFSEIIAIWLVSTWEILGRPKNINIIELGPGDGTLMKDLLDTLDKFPEFNSSKSVYLYEVSSFLKKIQKKKIKRKKVLWVNNFKQIKKGPVIFFGNEFFDAIPIKQFKKKRGNFFEKYFLLNQKNEIKEIFKKASKRDVKILKSYKSLKKLDFIEFPKIGLDELSKVTKKISKSGGCLLMIDYGYIKSSNNDTLQSVIKHKRNHILNNLGKADITAHVNFELLNEFFKKNNLKVKKIMTQQDFLRNMGIIERAENISKNMRFTEKTNLFLRLKRLMSHKLMGNLFKVILTYKSENNNYFGFN